MRRVRQGKARRGKARHKKSATERHEKAVQRADVKEQETRATQRSDARHKAEACREIPYKISFTTATTRPGNGVSQSIRNWLVGGAKKCCSVHAASGMQNGRSSVAGSPGAVSAHAVPERYGNIPLSGGADAVRPAPARPERNASGGWGWFVAHAAPERYGNIPLPGEADSVRPAPARLERFCQAAPAAFQRTGPRSSRRVHPAPSLSVAIHMCPFRRTRLSTFSSSSPRSAAMSQTSRFASLPPSVYPFRSTA